MPEIAIDGCLACHRIVCNRDARYLSDAALNRVDEREIGDNPRKKHAFRESLPVRCLLTIARAAEKEGSRGQIVNRFDAEFRLHCLQSANPQPRAILVRYAFSRCLFRPVAVMRFIVEHNDIPLPTERAANPAHHLIVGFIELCRAFAKNLPAEPTHVGIFSMLECVVVRDDNFRMREGLLVIGRQQPHFIVVIARDFRT